MNKMKYFGYFLLFVLVSALAGLLILPDYAPISIQTPQKELENPAEPYDWLMLQRSWPDASLDVEAYTASMRQAYAQAKNARSASTVSWTLEGPGNIGGRMNCIAIDSSNPQLMYAGSTCGGLWKTTDGGQTWLPVFDNNASLSIGCIAFEPGNSNTVYVGTGDPNISGYPFIGDGIYKTTDGGQTWTNIGLGNTYIIADIVIDPTNVNTIYAATMGLPFVRNTDRGLYKSIDGGLTWTQVLFVDTDAGIIDLILDPVQPQILYAASWNRIRNNQETVIDGPDSKIWKSIDGGANWTIAMTGIPNQSFSRIGMCMYPGDHNRLYAVFVDTTLELHGIYKTGNAAASWTSVNTSTIDPSALGGFGWYFGKINVNPNDSNDLFLLGIDQWRTSNGGLSWATFTPPWYTYSVHADGHDLEFAPNGDLLLCTDGGIYRSSDNAVTWNDIENLPVTQFYRVGTNSFQPTLAYGGAQDNGTTGGNAAMLNAWPRIFGGDGFSMFFDPTNPNLWYAETQNGNVVYTDDGGFSYFSFVIGDTSDRPHWDMPYLMSVHDPSTLYFATNRVHKMTGAPNGFANSISPDLTDGIIYEPRFHTITALGESPLVVGNIYAGTLDGNVWVTTNDGVNWTNVTGALPDRYVTAIKGSPNTASTIYVTHSGYKSNDFIPHVHKSIDDGATWIDISGDLPQFAVNDIEILPGNDNALFIATDAGVYYTTNGGVNWLRAGNNMPVIPVYDIKINTFTNQLIAGTFARSIQTLSISNLITGTSVEADIPIQIQLWPNPTTNFLTLQLPKAADVVIYDLNGRAVLQFRANAGASTSDITQLSSGTYILTARDDRNSRTIRFIKHD